MKLEPHRKLSLQESPGLGHARTYITQKKARFDPKLNNTGRNHDGKKGIHSSKYINRAQ